MSNFILKAKIVEKFMTQSDFAEVLKVNESKISQVVRGRRKLNGEDQKKWAAALDVEPGAIFEER
jgi:plasmid maintenance system antidote protein VapI